MTFLDRVFPENDTLDEREQEMNWKVLTTASIIVDVIGLCFTLMGFLFNYFSFITANHLPESSSAFLMKYIAVWDSISLFKIGLLDSGLTMIGLQWELYSVSSRSKNSNDTSGIRPHNRSKGSPFSTFLPCYLILGAKNAYFGHKFPKIA